MNKNLTELIIVIVLWISVGLSLALNFKFSNQFTLGIISLTISTILYFINKKLNLYFLIFILFLSVFNLISFSNSFGLNFNTRFFSISIINILLFSILLYNYRNLLFQDYFKNKQSEIKDKSIVEINFFKRQFQNLSEEELTRKLNDENIVKEAKVALKELINEKYG